MALTDLLPTELTATGGNGAISQGSYNATTGLWSVGTLNNGASATLTLEGTVNAGAGGSTVTNVTTAAAGDQPDPSTVGDDLTEAVVVNNAGQPRDGQNPGQRRRYSGRRRYSHLPNYRHQQRRGPSHQRGAHRLTAHGTHRQRRQWRHLPRQLQRHHRTLVGGHAQQRGLGDLDLGRYRQRWCREWQYRDERDDGSRRATNPILHDRRRRPHRIRWSSTTWTDLVTVKTLASGDATPDEGDTVTFLITVTNNGAAQATNVALTDLLPTELTATGGNGAISQGSYNATTGLWSVGTLNNGASATLTLEGTVNAGAGGNTVTNVTTAAAGDQPDPSTVGDDLTEAVVVNNAADLVTVKTLASGDATPDEGDTVTFLITVTNNGAAQATNVALTDVCCPRNSPPPAATAPFRKAATTPPPDSGPWARSTTGPRPP